MASWRRARGNSLPLKFGLSQNFRLKMQNWGTKPPIWVKFGGKIEILSTCNIRPKFAAVCRKIATSCRATFFSPRGPRRR